MGELTPAMSSTPAGLLPASIALGAAGAEGQGYITLFPICHCSYLSPPHGTRAAAPAAGTAGAGGDAEGRRSSGCSEAAVFRRQRERSPAAEPGRDLCLPSASPGSCHRGRAAGDVVRVWPPMRGGGGFALPALPSVPPGAAGRCRCRHSEPCPRPVQGTPQRWHRLSSGTRPRRRVLPDPRRAPSLI